MTDETHWPAYSMELAFKLELFRQHDTVKTVSPGHKL